MARRRRRRGRPAAASLAGLWHAARRALARGGRVAASARAAGAAAARRARRALRRWRGPGPVVIVDAGPRRARRLRRRLGAATRAQVRALGVPLPAHLLLVVQRSVGAPAPPDGSGTDGTGRSLAALLEVYEDAAGTRRHVLFLALTVGGAPRADADVVATLRQQLQVIVADELGTLRYALATPGPAPSGPGVAAPPGRATDAGAPPTARAVPAAPALPEPPADDDWAWPEEAPAPDPPLAARPAPVPAPVPAVAGHG